MENGFSFLICRQQIGLVKRFTLFQNTLLNTYRLQPIGSGREFRTKVLTLTCPDEIFQGGKTERFRLKAMVLDPLSGK